MPLATLSKDKPESKPQPLMKAHRRTGGLQWSVDWVMRLFGKPKSKHQQLHTLLRMEGLQQHIAKAITRSFVEAKKANAAFERLNYVVELEECSPPQVVEQGVPLQEYCHSIMQQDDPKVWQEMADFYRRLTHEKVNSVFLAADMTLDDLNLPRNNKDRDSFIRPSRI